MQYRRNVAAVIINKNSVLLVHNKNHGPSFWKFPQGGVERHETEKKAILRELKEELGINDFKLLFKSKVIHKYDWPLEIQKEKGFKGQLQSFWVFEYNGNKDFDLSGSDLDDFEWITFNDLPLQFELKDMKNNAKRLVAEIKKKPQD